MTPFQSLLLLFILIPIFEIYLLISVGSFLGVLPTILRRYFYLTGWCFVINTRLFYRRGGI